MSICLTLVEQNSRIVSFVFDKEEVSVGRSSASDVTPDPFVYTQVSRNHGRIRRVAEGRFIFEDLASTHGSWFHGKVLKSPLVLTRGDSIVLGEDGPTLCIDWVQERITGREGTHLRRRMKNDPAFPLVFSTGFLGFYNAYDKIGAGGFGEVWRGMPINGGPPVAIKLMHPSLLDPDTLSSSDRQSLISRFVREARLTHQLADSGAPFIPRVHAWGDDADRDYLYIVMELIDGVGLDQYINPGRLLPVDRVCRIMSDVAQTLEAAHNFEFNEPDGRPCRGIIHRDVKPNNIVLEQKTDRAWLIDFGIARILDGAERLTSTNITVGTHQFLPPENLESNLASPATDLWGFTVTLYVALSGGRFPYVGTDRARLLQALRKGEIIPIHSLRPDVPAELQQAIARSLSFDPAARISSAAEWLRVLRNQPMEALRDDATA